MRAYVVTPFAILKKNEICPKISHFNLLAGYEAHVQNL